MARWTSRDPKPRVPFCWECSRRLHGRQHDEVTVDGIPRVLHKDCARRVCARLGIDLRQPEAGKGEDNG